MRGAILRARAEWSAADGEPPELKGASLGGRALNALAAKWAPHPPNTGVYQALGHEKLELTHRFTERARAGFANMKATAPVLELSGYGPFVSLAIAQGLRGPFWTLEADALAGGAALQQALADLALGRCERALVGDCTLDGAAQLLLLEATGAPEWAASFAWSATRHDPAPDDPHGLRALADAIERRAEVCFLTPEGRGLTVTFS